MTLERARLIFSTHMAAMKKRKLTAYEQAQLARASQVLRYAKRRNPGRRGGMALRRRNPGKSTRGKTSKKVALIYPHVLRIEAQKGKRHNNCDVTCIKCGHKYFHDFKNSKRVRMIGLHPGQVFKVPAGCWPLLIIGK